MKFCKYICCNIYFDCCVLGNNVSHSQLQRGCLKKIRKQSKSKHKLLDTLNTFDYFFVNATKFFFVLIFLRCMLCNRYLRISSASPTTRLLNIFNSKMIEN